MKHSLLEQNALGRSKADAPEGIRSINTMSQYIKIADRYANWLKSEQISARSLNTCANYIQTYLDHLKENGKSATTIHTYASALAKATNTRLEDYNIPRRTEELTRSRDIDKHMRVDQNEQNEKFARLVDFAKAVGIRREEYANLRQDNLIERDNRLYVVVEQGKGGKYQEQAISRENEALVRSYFNGNHDEHVFKPEELKNKLDLHAIRAEHARECYQAKIEEYKQDPSARERDFKALQERFDLYSKDWRACDDMRILERDLESRYFTRGIVREQLTNEGRDTSFDRLATMVVSVENLAHYRCDVTVGHYFR